MDYFIIIQWTSSNSREIFIKLLEDNNMLKGLNHLGQKINKNILKPLSDLNAIEQLLEGHPNPAKRKAKNKLKRIIGNKIIK